MKIFENFRKTRVFAIRVFIFNTFKKFQSISIEITTNRKLKLGCLYVNLGEVAVSNY